MKKPSGKNRDILIALILVGIVVAMAGYYFSSRHYFEKYLTYEDRLYGIRIEHPASWSTAFEHKVIKENGVINLIAFRTPDARTGDIDKFVNITTYPIPQGLSFADSMFNEIKIMQGIYRNFKLMESTMTTLGGLPARRFVFTFSKKGTTYKKLQIHVQKGQQGYALGYLQDIKNFDWYKTQVEKMINSFAFIQP